jgi:amino acid transporter
MTMVVYSYIPGLEIVAVTASEARFPRDDLPPASRRIFWTIFSLYLAAIFSVSLNVPYTDCNLYDPFINSDKTTGRFSPFIIAIKNAGFDFPLGFVNACFVFANWSVINTELYVASRTLYGMAARLDPEAHPYLSIFSRTTKSGVPMTAIFGSMVLAPLAYLQLGGNDSLNLLTIFTQVTIVGCLIVWMCQCISFIRFYNGLQIRGAPHNRLSSDYPYASSFQPWSAIFGAVGCALLILFNGFDYLILSIWMENGKTVFKRTEFLAAYLAVFVCVGVYLVLKVQTRAPLKRNERMEYGVRRENFDMRRPSRERGRLMRILGWIFG